MNTFYISVKKSDQIFHYLEKTGIDLDISSNIVKQAEDFVSSILASMNMVYSEDDYSWKVYRHDGSKYQFVTKSKNWADE